MSYTTPADVKALQELGMAQTEEVLGKMQDVVDAAQRASEEAGKYSWKYAFGNAIEP